MASGFSKVVYLDKEVPVYEMLHYGGVDFKKDYDREDVISVNKYVFYFEREFYDEFEQKVLVYKERS